MNFKKNSMDRSDEKYGFVYLLQRLFQRLLHFIRLKDNSSMYTWCKNYYLTGLYRL